MIVPVRRGGDHLGRCMASLAALQPTPMELFVVFDGEADPGWEREAGRAGARALHLPGPRGPAHARNAGAREARGDLLFFVDVDVTVPPDIVERAVAVFEQDPGLAAAFGSYDDAPAEPNFLSQYKNLLHHYMHQRSGGEAFTFWSGCGLIRREVFEAVGGFDEDYRIPCVEDLELGGRLRQAGHRIRLVETLQVKHLKRWTAFTLLKAEVLYRAMPWTRLLMEQGKIPNTLNLTRSSRLSAALLGASLGSLAAAPLCPVLLVPAGAGMVVVLLLNWDLYRFFAEKRGPGFALACIPWHWSYYLYSSACFGVGFLQHQIGRWRR